MTTMNTHSTVRVVLLLMGLPLLYIRCDRMPEAEEPGPTLDVVRSLQLRDSMRSAAQQKDTSLCDQLLTQFEDARLAANRPDVVAHAYVSDVIAHGRVRHDLLDRLALFTERTGSTYLANWHEYLRGRMAMEHNEQDSATALFTEVYPRFQAAADTEGLSLVAKRLGMIYKERLNEPRKAVPFLKQYFSLARDPVDRYLAAAHLSGVYVLLNEPDSAAKGLAYMDQHLDELESMVPGNPSFRGYRGIVRFDHMYRRAMEHDATALDSLQKQFDGLIGLLEATHEIFQWNPVAIRVQMARALLANGEKNEARSVLQAGIHIAEECPGCVLANIELYDQLVDMARSYGDPAAALDYLIAENRWRDTVNLDLNSSEVDKVRKTMILAHQRDSLALEKQSAESKAELALAKGRWQRNLLLLTAALILILGAWLLNRARLKRAIDMANVRSRLSRDLHDDIGSTLSSINILSNVVKKRAQANGDIDAAASMEKISERSQRLMRDMSDIVWSVDPSKDSLSDLIGRMREYGASVLEPKSIHFQFQTGQDLPKSLPPEVKKNLYLIFKETLNNAAKHSGADRVEVAINVEDGRLHMRIIDNGKGLEGVPEVIQGGGNGLRNMKTRAQEIHATLKIEGLQGCGTAIRVDVPL